MPGGRYGLECKIYVGDLPRDASEQELEKAFSYYGALKNVWVARNPPGFAFIEYDDVRDAEDAVRGMDGTTLCGSRIRCEHSSGKSGPKAWSGSSGGGRGGGGGGGGGGGSRDGGGRGPPRLRKPYDPNDRCYECGGRGHYAYDCTRGSGGRRHSRSRSGSGSRSGSRDRGHGKRDRSASPRGRYYRSRSRSRSRGRYYRSRSRSRSRGRYRTRSRSGSRAPERSAARYRSRSRSPMRSSEKNNRYSRSRSRERKSNHGSPSRNGGD